MKVALDSVNRFHAESVRYAMLEAASLVRVVELGGINKLSGNRKRMGKWLFGLNSDDRNRYIQMCQDGLTIDNVYMREIREKEKIDDALQEINRHEKEALECLQEDGFVDLTFTRQEIKRLCSGTILEPYDYTERIRKNILKVGGVGVGNNTGLYIIPDCKKSEELLYAIITRIESIGKDVANIRNLLMLCGSEIGFGDIEAAVQTYNECGISRNHIDKELWDFLSSWQMPER